MEPEFWERWRDEAVRDFLQVLEKAHAERKWGRFGVVVSMSEGEPTHRVVTVEETRK